MNSKTKICVACNLVLDEEKFVKNQIACTNCIKKFVPYNKVCIECNKIKPSKMFTNFGSMCQECTYWKNRKPPERKLCDVCGEEKTKSKFKKNQTTCIACNNVLKITTQEIEKPQTKQEKRHVYYIANKEKNKERYETDPHYRSIKLHRGSIRSLVKGKLQNCKTMHSDRKQYIMWLEEYFEENMTIENHGKIWEIDHVIPLSMIKHMGEKSIYLFFWFNTAPVFPEYNRRKNGNLCKHQLKCHMIFLNNFINKNRHHLIFDENYYCAYKDIAQNLL